MPALHVVQTIASIDPETGGPARTVTSLCCALARLGLGATLLTQEPRAQPLPFALPDGVHFTRRGRFKGLADFRRSLDAALVRPGVGASGDILLHDHGVWLPNNHVAASTARRRGVTRIVSPRGMLDEWALRWHGWRKRLAWRLYQHRDLREARAFHATSRAEAAALRRLGLSQPIAVVPNGVDVPARPPAPRTGSPRVALFLSRVHPKKGLAHLVDAWAAIRPQGWALWIAGSGEPSHMAALEASVREAFGAQSGAVRLLGHVPDGERAALFAQAELFVLPTLSENFGQVVAEALAAGLPVLTTRAAPWDVLEQQRAGWWIEPGTAALEGALRVALTRPPGELAAMGARGRAWAAGALAWDAVAARMAAVYAWLARGGAPPPDVLLEEAA